MMKIKMARFLPGPLYRMLTLRFHAASLASPHDGEGQIPWSKKDSYDLFLENTPYRSYVNRARAAFGADYTGSLNRISVPTLIITPSYDRLIGEEAARRMLEAIPNVRETILPRTGHMFRFSHPVTYAQVVENFIREVVVSSRMKSV
jgi:pimeloyl-ACP methyl ester carboxylesterase